MPNSLGKGFYKAGRFKKWKNYNESTYGTFVGMQLLTGSDPL